MNFLLDYFFKITTITPTAQASTAFLKQVCVVVKPKIGVTTGVITQCTNMTQVGALTDNTEAQQLFNAGMAKVFILPMDDLDLAAALLGHESDFYTLLISSDFADEEITGVGSVAGYASLKIQDILYTAKTIGAGGNDITIEYVDDGTAGAETVDVTDSAIVVHIESGVSTAAQIKTAVDADVDAAALVSVAVDAGDETDPQVTVAETNLTGGTSAVTGAMDLGEFEGVVGVSSDDDAFLATQAAIGNRCAFHTTTTNKAKNMFFAFGSMLSNSLNWKNQQYIEMPVADDVADLGSAEALFDDKISFVISDDQYANRLGLFCCGGKAIVAPYIKKNFEIDLQSEALTFISGNQPDYNITQAALLEDELKKNVLQLYFDRKWLTAGTVEIKIENDNFVASGYINIAEPKAFWRIFGEMRTTL